MTIRDAILSDAKVLTELALRAKAHWGYDAAFIEDCRADLTITREVIANGAVRVLEAEGKPVAFYTLEPHGTEVELAHFFVEPARIGKGYGKRLWNDAVETARSLAYGSLLITSDPFAEGFYLAMGAERVGTSSSPIRPGRELPLLRNVLRSTNLRSS